MRLVRIALFAFLPLAAQEIKLPASLDRLAEKAAEVVDVTMDQSMLQLASRFLSDKTADEAKVKRLVSGLKGVYVKSFEFEKTGEYDPSDVEAIRTQLRAPGWARIVGVRNRKNGENAEVFIKNEGGQIGGLTIIAAEPKELTIVNIVGAIRPEDLRDLGGNFGIPRMDTSSIIPQKKAERKED